jgi:hypothetical protein
MAKRRITIEHVAEGVFVRSDGKVCEIKPTRAGGRKLWRARVYRGKTSARGKLVTDKTTLVRTLAAARAFCRS